MLSCPETQKKIKASYPEIFKKCSESFANLIHKFDPRSALEVSPEERQAFYEQIWSEPGFRKWLGNFQDIMSSKEANDTFARHLYNHAEQWFLFLIDPRIPATNHRAEQGLKTPIVNRKVWGGNRTAAGGDAQQVTSSVLQTCKNKAVDVISFVSDAFRGTLGSLFTAPAG